MNCPIWTVQFLCWLISSRRVTGKTGKSASMASGSSFRTREAACDQLRICQRLPTSRTGTTSRPSIRCCGRAATRPRSRTSCEIRLRWLDTRVRRWQSHFMTGWSGSAAPISLFLLFIFWNDLYLFFYRYEIFWLFRRLILLRSGLD